MAGSLDNIEENDDSQSGIKMRSSGMGQNNLNMMADLVERAGHENENVDSFGGGSSMGTSFESLNSQYGGQESEEDLNY